MADDCLPPVDLATELCVGIARAIPRIAEAWMEDFQDQALDGYIFHTFANVFEDMSLQFWMMGLALAAYQNGEAELSYDEGRAKRFWPGFVRFLPESELRACFARGLPPHTPSEHRLLTAYLELHDWTRPPFLCCERRSFEPDPVYWRELAVMAEHGYLLRSGTKFAWTNRAGKAMQMAGIWTEDLRHWQTEAEEAARQEAEIAVWLMPPYIHAFIMGHGLGPRTGASIALDNHWTGSAWVEAAGKRKINQGYRNLLLKAVTARMDLPS